MEDLHGVIKAAGDTLPDAEKAAWAGRVYLLFFFVFLVWHLVLFFISSCSKTPARVLLTRLTLLNAPNTTS